jgi:magnesium transporter
MNTKHLLDSIDPAHLDNLDTDNHYTLFDAEDNYQILIIRGINISSDELKFYSRRFFINENKLFEYTDHKLNSLDCSIDNILKILSPIFDQNQKIIEEFAKEIDRLEDSLFDRSTSRIFMDNWFDLKKDLARIERYYNRAINVLNSFQKYFSNDESFPQAGFQDLMSNISYVLHHVGNQTSKLDALHNYYSSLKSDKLNNNLYTLTVISAVFLPLNLVVGFFGMNTENLFFKDSPHGTQYVLMILVGTFLLAFIGIPFVKFLDRYLLRFLLGKSHIYKKVSGKIDKIEEILKMD